MEERDQQDKEQITPYWADNYHTLDSNVEHHSLRTFAHNDLTGSQRSRTSSFAATQDGGRPLLAHSPSFASTASYADLNRTMSSNPSANEYHVGSRLPLPDDGELLEIIREAVAYQRKAEQGEHTSSHSAGPATPLDEAGLVLAIRKALGDITSSASGISTPQDGSVASTPRRREASGTGISSPFLGPDESTMVASLKRPPPALSTSAPTPSKTSPTTPTGGYLGDESTMIAALKGTSSPSSPNSPSSTNSLNPPLRNTAVESARPLDSPGHSATPGTEERALLMAIKGVLASSIRSKPGVRHPRREAAPREPRVRHEADGGTLLPASPGDDVLPPMYNPEWVERRRVREGAMVQPEHPQ